MRIIGITAAALIALVAWYLLRDRDSRAVTAAPSTHSPAVTAARTHAQPTLPQAVDDPTEVVDATHATMQAIGRRCFVTRTPRPAASNQADDSVGRLELRLGIRIADGTAHVQTTDVVATRRLRDDIRDCIVAASRAATWSVAAPDGSHDIVELFRMGDFIAVPGPDSPPSAPPTR
jgi:hypothetical protein